MRDTITLEGIEAFGYHGVFDHERGEGQTFRVDVEIETSFDDAITSDDVAHTIDYGVLATRVVDIVQGEPANLIETVCDRVLTMVLSLGAVHAARVTIHKPQAPIEVPFSNVSVSMRREATP
ncbi:MAG: dihydroneopterin aldolase [Microbacteriaceae bacterium]|nr:dihydroneopterin aldolase [Microbacteriaceae bacterium]